MRDFLLQCVPYEIYEIIILAHFFLDLIKIFFQKIQYFYNNIFKPFHATSKIFVEADTVPCWKILRNMLDQRVLDLG